MNIKLFYKILFFFLQKQNPYKTVGSGFFFSENGTILYNYALLGYLKSKGGQTGAPRPSPSLQPALCRALPLRTGFASFKGYEQVKAKKSR